MSKTHTTMEKKLLNESAELFDWSCNLHKKAERKLKRFLIDNVGVGKELYLNEEDYMIDTNENGGDFDYAGKIRIMKRWEEVSECEEGAYDIEFMWEYESEEDSKWKRLDNYDWDLGTLIDAIRDAIDSNEYTEAK